MGGGKAHADARLWEVTARRKRYTQKALIKKLKQHGWEESAGGKHQVKMIREGHRPVTLPEFKGETLPVGLSRAILRQAGIDDNI